MTSEQSKWKWTAETQKAFDDIKNVMARNVMLSYPNFDLPFYMKPDASDFQLGAVIYQIVDGEHTPIAFYSHKLNSAQKNYTIMEKELLSIIEIYTLLSHPTRILPSHPKRSQEPIL